mmetsp:Transcript_11946/g.32219  ORF Transcript_11946/g.32219 Transcript_11946/m.32219 type:complete len:328 (-) Transcript_11946:1123-2106(-)
MIEDKPLGVDGLGKLARHHGSGVPVRTRGFLDAPRAFVGVERGKERVGGLVNQHVCIHSERRNARRVTRVAADNDFAAHSWRRDGLVAHQHGTVGELEFIRRLHQLERLHQLVRVRVPLRLERRIVLGEERLDTCGIEFARSRSFRHRKAHARYGMLHGRRAYHHTLLSAARVAAIDLVYQRPAPIRVGPNVRPALDLSEARVRRQRHVRRLGRLLSKILPVEERHAVYLVHAVGRRDAGESQLHGGAQVCAQSLWSVDVDHLGGAIEVLPHQAEHAGEPESVVAMRVRYEDLLDARGPHARALQVDLGSLARVEHPERAVPPQHRA